MGTHRESNALVASPPINTTSTIHLRPHQRHRTSRSIKQHRQTLKRPCIPAHSPPIPLLPRPLRNRNSILPPPHPHAPQLQVPSSHICDDTALPSQSAHQHGIASFEFHKIVPATIAGVELRSAEQRERRVVGGHYQQCRRAGDFTGLRVCASSAVGGCRCCLQGGSRMGKLRCDRHERVLFTNMLCSAFYAQLAWEEALLLLVLSRLGT